MALRGVVVSGGVGVFLLLEVWALTTDPRLWRNSLADGGLLLRASWIPQLAAGVLGGLLAVFFGHRRELDKKVRYALSNQPVNLQLGWFGFCLVASIASMALMKWMLDDWGLGADLGELAPMSLVSRVLFFLVLPMMAIDGLLAIFRGQGEFLPRITMKVTEWWRWLCVAPALLATVLMACLIFPFGTEWSPSLIVLGMAAGFVVVAVSEEVFFRVMIQSRLEVLWGRWGGVVNTSLLFALFYAFVRPYTVLIPIPDGGLVHDIGISLLTYTPIGLLCGYLWSCYRNIYVNIMLRVGLLFIANPPFV